MEKIENLIKLAPLGSIFIFFCSSIKLVLFYNFFNVSIVDYIAIQEFLVLFIDDLLRYLCIFGIGIILSLFENTFYNGDSFVLKSTIPEKYKYERKVCLVLIIMTFFSMVVLSFTIETKSAVIEMIGFGIFLILSIFRVFLSSTRFIFPYPLLVITCIIIYSAMYGSRDAQKIIENNATLNYVLVFKEKTYKTDNNLKYLGKTENYLFLYNLKSKRTTILKNDELIKIHIK